MTKETLTIEVIRDNYGYVDETSTIYAFKDLLYKLSDDIENELLRIGNTIQCIFDENKGATIKLSTIAWIACNKMNIPLEANGVMSKRVLSYLHNYSIGIDSKFIITSGKKGGVKRRINL